MLSCKLHSPIYFRPSPLSTRSPAGPGGLPTMGRICEYSRFLGWRLNGTWPVRTDLGKSRPCSESTEYQECGQHCPGPSQASPTMGGNASSSSSLFLDKHAEFVELTDGGCRQIRHGQVQVGQPAPVHEFCL